MKVIEKEAYCGKLSMSSYSKGFATVWTCIRACDLKEQKTAFLQDIHPFGVREEARDPF